MRSPTATIDAGFWSVGAPNLFDPSNLSTTNDIVIIALTDEEMAAAISADPVMSRTTLPGGSYTGIDEDITVLGIPNVLAVLLQEMPDGRGLCDYPRDVRQRRRTCRPSTRRRTRPRIEFTNVGHPGPAASRRDPLLTRRSAPRSRTACANERGLLIGWFGGGLSALLLLSGFNAAAGGRSCRHRRGRHRDRTPARSPRGRAGACCGTTRSRAFRSRIATRNRDGPNGAGALGAKPDFAAGLGAISRAAGGRSRTGRAATGSSDIDEPCARQRLYPAPGRGTGGSPAQGR